MTKNIKSKSRRKPAKPFRNFPLTAHPSGQWSKKATLPSGKQRIFYFGVWADPDAALQRFNREWPFLKEGRTPPPVDTGDGCSIKRLANVFLTAKQAKVASGELSGHSLGDYRKTTDRMVSYFGGERRVDDLRPDDFEGFRKSMASTLGVVALRNEINRVRIVLKYAYENRLIDRPVAYGQGFDKPAVRVLRKARHEAGVNLLEADEVRRILDAADPILRAMVYLAINTGCGNTDIGNLPESAIDWAAGWLNYPRPKTQIARRCKLWPETLQALRTALDLRPEPKDPADAGMIFLTVQGNRWVRCTPSKTTEGKFAVVDTLSSRFKALLKGLGINGRRRLGFYTLRHCFETAAGEGKDQVAVDACMGHVDTSMAAAYRERISDGRLEAVAAVVRSWLFGPAAGERAGLQAPGAPVATIQEQAGADPLAVAVARCRAAIEAAEGPTRRTLESVWLPEIANAAEHPRGSAADRLLDVWGERPEAGEKRPVRLRVVGAE